MGAQRVVTGFRQTLFRPSVPRPPNVALLRALGSLLDGIWGVLKGSWGVLVKGHESSRADSHRLPLPKVPKRKVPTQNQSFDS